MVRARHLVAALVALGGAVAAARETPADRQPPVDGAAPLEKLSIEELMGVRVRSPAMTSQPVETAPSEVSVITGDQIHALGLRTLADALQLMPGVTVLDTQFNGQRVVVRGLA